VKVPSALRAFFCSVKKRGREGGREAGRKDTRTGFHFHSLSFLFTRRNPSSRFPSQGKGKEGGREGGRDAYFDRLRKMSGFGLSLALGPNGGHACFLR